MRELHIAKVFVGGRMSFEVAPLHGSLCSKGPCCESPPRVKDGVFFSTGYFSLGLHILIHSQLSTTVVKSKYERALWNLLRRSD